MKKMLAIILSMVVAFVFTINPSSSMAISEVNSNQVIKHYETYYDLQTGEEIGQSEIKTKYKVKHNKDQSKTIIIITDVKVKYHNGQIEKNQYVDEIVYVSVEEAYWNGQSLNMNEEIHLHELESHTSNSIGMMSSASGGVSYLSYYNQENTPSLNWEGGYMMRSYPSVKSQTSLTGLLLDPGSGEGTMISKYNWTYGTYGDKTRLFQVYAQQVENARSYISTTVPVLMFELSVTVLTVATIIGALIAGGTVAATATAIYGFSNSGRVAVENAYAVLANEIVSGAR